MLVLCNIVMSMVAVFGQDPPDTTYFQFSDLGPWTSDLGQTLTEPARNFATLMPGAAGALPSTSFTICSSIYIGYFRGQQAFYTLKRRGQLWFSVYINTQDPSTQSYTSFIDHAEGNVQSNANLLRLRPHAWSHACTSVDAELGHVVVVINGVETHNEIITNSEFLDNGTITFDDNLVLGVFGKDLIQSEASITNVHIFTKSLDASELVASTSQGMFGTGDHLSWDGAKWNLTGEVKTVKIMDLIGARKFPNLFLFGNNLRWWKCKDVCSKIQEGGRIPSVGNVSEAESLLSRYNSLSTKWENVLSPFVYERDGQFVDYFTRSAIPPSLQWWPSEPNGGTNEQCASWSSYQNRLFDASCEAPYNCMCDFESRPILTLRGLCEATNVDSHYAVNNDDGTIVFLGLTGRVAENICGTLCIKGARPRASVGQRNTTEYEVV